MSESRLGFRGLCLLVACVVACSSDDADKKGQRPTGSETRGGEGAADGVGGETASEEPSEEAGEQAPDPEPEPDPDDMDAGITVEDASEPAQPEPDTMDASTPTPPADDDAGEPPPMAADAAAADGGNVTPAPEDATQPMQPECTTPPGRVLPTELRCTGLYGDWAAKTLAEGVREYRPAYELYSDGAEKHRYFALPEGTHVDGANPQGFVYPEGTQFWKEFRVDVNGERRLAETRLLRKTSAGWVYTSYAWNEAGDDAVQTNDGATNVVGSEHDIPTLEQCQQCHAGRADFILGWDPIMLGPGATGVDLGSLVESGALQNVSGTAPRIPGQDFQALGLAYLHANCGISCHNPDGDAKDSGLFMRLDVDKLDRFETTPAIATGLFKTPWENAKIQTLEPPRGQSFVDIFPLRSDLSLIAVRMQVRGTEAQMPPIASEKVDEDGVAIVRALIGD